MLDASFFSHERVFKSRRKGALVIGIILQQFSPAKYMVNSNSTQNLHNFFIQSHATAVYHTCLNCTPVTHVINLRRGKIRFASAYL